MNQNSLIKEVFLDEGGFINLKYEDVIDITVPAKFKFEVTVVNDVVKDGAKYRYASTISLTAEEIMNEYYAPGICNIVINNFHIPLELFVCDKVEEGK